MSDVPAGQALDALAACGSTGCPARVDAVRVHLSGQTPEPARVYRSEVRNLVATLGLRAISGT